jgi:hypothetical protein
MSYNNVNPNKGNESEKKHKQNQRTARTLDTISPADIFGTKSPTETDGVVSESGKFVLWLNNQDNIYVEQREGKRIPRQYRNYLQRLENRGVARDVFQESTSRIEICVDRWIISDKRDTGRKTNEVGDAEDLLPIVAEAL